MNQLKNSMKLLVMLGILVSAGAMARGSILYGSHEGHGFQVNLSPSADTARLRWNDGYPGFTAYYNANPNPAPRCRCDVYENGRRRITVERDIQSGALTGYVQFQKL